MTKRSDDSQALDLTALKTGLERNPYGVVAGAVGVGFILGGGLFTRLTGRLFGAAVRVAFAAALPYLQEELLSVAARAIEGDSKGKDKGTKAAATKSPAPSPRQA